MEFKELQQIINTMSESKLSSLEIEWEGVTIRMKKEGKEVIKEVNQPAIMEKENINASEDFNLSSDEKLYIVKSPIVGTFYTSPGEDKEQYISVGDQVKKGQTLCIIEAMKLMNEIECDVDGEIVDIVVKNGEMVEYGQGLIKIKQN